MEVSAVQGVKLKNKNMKKQILNLGKTLNKTEQTQISGGSEIVGLCDFRGNCPRGSYCADGYICLRD